MIDITLNEMQKTFEEYEIELKRKREKIDILKAANQKQSLNKDNTNQNSGLYGIFICYYFFVDQNNDIRKMIKDTKKFEDSINKCSEKSYKTLIKAIIENKMSNIFLDKSLLELYNAFSQYFSSQQIVTLIEMFIGNVFIGNVLLAEKQSISDFSDLSSKIEHLDQKDVYYAKVYDSVITEIVDKINQYIDDYSTSLKRLKKMADIFLEAQESLEHNGEKPIVSIPDRWKSCFTDKILYYFYQIIYNNQLSKNEKLDLSLMKYSNTSDQDQINSILHKYHLSLDLFINKELIIKYCDVRNAGLILRELKTVGINLDYCLLHGLEYVLIGSKPEIVADIIRYIDNGILSKEFVENNLGIFINCDAYEHYLKQEIQFPKPKYEIISNNIGTYKANKIDFSSKSFKEKHLLNDPLIVSQIIELMSKYNLKNPEIINNLALMDIVDLLIEKDINVGDLDFGNIEEHDIKLICKRIIIAYMVDLIIIKENKLTSEIITGNRFIIGDDQLDDYISDDTSSLIPDYISSILKGDKRLAISDECLKNETITKLDQTIINEDGNYEFDKTIISRNKVLRNLSSILRSNPDYKDSLLPAIIFNSYLSTEEIESINKYLTPRVYEKDDK